MGWTAALGLLRLARGSNLHEICAVLLIVRKITTPLLSDHLNTASHDGGSLQFLVEMLTNKIIVATDDDIISNVFVAFLHYFNFC